jgi:hypothetical protein
LRCAATPTDAGAPTWCRHRDERNSSGRRADGEVRQVSIEEREVNDASAEEGHVTDTAVPSDPSGVILELERERTHRRMLQQQVASLFQLAAIFKTKSAAASGATFMIGSGSR